MQLSSFLDVVQMNAMLHGRIQHVAHNEVIYATAFPSSVGYPKDGKYDTTTEVLTLSSALQKVSCVLKSKRRVEALQSAVKQKKDTKTGPVIILVCNGIKQISGGKHTAPDNVVVWTSTCPWLL